jgi:hypothetical protein
MSSDSAASEGGAAAWRDLFDRLEAFVERFAHRPPQLSDEWMRKRLTCVGASELGNLLGLVPYPDSGPSCLVARKANFDDSLGRYLNWFCVFGQMLEGAITLVVEVDLGTPVVGDTINVPAPFAGHANSPDGYGVIWIVPPKGPAMPPSALDAVSEGTPADGVKAVNLLSVKAEDPTMHHIWTTDENGGTPPGDAVPISTLLEFKSPPKRQPGKRPPRSGKGPVPPHYVPQVWSGLELSAEGGVRLGLFVDAAFRVCSIDDVGFGPRYNTSLHRERRPKNWDAPFATGVIGLYASTPLPIDLSTGSPEVRDVGGREEEIDSARTPVRFDNFCRLVSARMICHQPGRPAFADGRGASLEEARSPPADSGKPSHPHLVGVLGWKLFRVEYVPVYPRKGFLAEVRPMIESTLAEAAAIRDADDPRRAWQKKYDPVSVEAEDILLGELAGLVDP